MNEKLELHSHNTDSYQINLYRGFLGWYTEIYLPDSTLGITMFIFGTRTRALRKAWALANHIDAPDYMYQTVYKKK